LDGMLPLCPGKVVDDLQPLARKAAMTLVILPGVIAKGPGGPCAADVGPGVRPRGPGAVNVRATTAARKAGACTYADDQLLKRAAPEARTSEVLPLRHRDLRPGPPLLSWEECGRAPVSWATFPKDEEPWACLELAIPEARQGPASEAALSRSVGMRPYARELGCIPRDEGPWA